MRVRIYLGYAAVALWMGALGWGASRLPHDAPATAGGIYLMAYGFALYGLLMLRDMHRSIIERERWIERNTNPETHPPKRDWWGWLKL